MTVEQLKEKFIKSPVYLDTGAGKLSKLFHCTKEDVYMAKAEARTAMQKNTFVELKKELKEEVAKYVGSQSDGETITKRFTSPKPLSPKEIEELVGVDNISTYIARVWDKLLPSGIWTYSVDIRYKIKDFYSKEELEVKLREIFPNTLTPFTLPEPDFVQANVATFIYIADDHAGLEFDNSLYGNSYSGSVYRSRMLELAKQIVECTIGPEHLFIIRLGDEADGYNARTTRYDHPLESLSNKEQFDIFTSVNKEFYDTIFASGIAEEYTIVNCNNSNHTGLGFSYMLNKSLEFYLEGRFPQVTVQHINEFIGGVEWGNHVIGLVHGKDEKYMKSPMPLNLDPKTDLWLFEYYDNKGYSPSTRFISTIKGDLHKFSITDGKSGRYVNVPSIAGGSPWIEHNFGNTKPGVLIEMIEKNSPNIGSQVIRF